MRRLGPFLALALLSCSRSPAPAPSPTPALSLAPAPAPAPTPAPAPAPAHPLACRSLDVRTTEAHLLYPGVPVATVDGTFLFIDVDHSPLFAKSLLFAPRALAALRHERIAPHPLCPTSVYVFGSSDHFKAHGTDNGRHYLSESGSNYGIYDDARGEIATDLSRGEAHIFTIAHELAHVLMDADAMAADWHAPRWFQECVASLYESPVLDDAHGVIHGTDDWRYRQLRPAVAAHAPAARLGVLFGMSDEDFLGQADAGTDGVRSHLLAGVSRAACQWLDAQDKLWPTYRAWRDGHVEDRDGVVAFTRIVGAAPTDEAEEKAWATWVSRTR